MSMLKGQVAVVTGGNQGIGRAICERLAYEGANIVIMDININGAEDLVKKLQTTGIKTMVIKVDVSDVNQVKLAMKQVWDRFNAINILVNNAGVAKFNDLLKITPEEMDRLYNINVRGLFFAMQSAAEYMKRQGGGKIINMSSQAGRRGEKFALTYCMTKAAVISMTQSAAQELAEHHIIVNAVAPGVIETPLWVSVDEQLSSLEKVPKGEFKRKSIENIPLGRIGYPEEVAKVVAFLAGNDSEYITSQTINVDGGNNMN